MTSLIEDSTNYVVEPQLLISAISEVYEGKFHKYVDSYGQIFLVRDGKYAGDYIYADSPSGDGFYGRDIEFQLISGEMISLKGPWKVNPNILLTATGIDKRDCQQNFVVIGLAVSFKGHRTIIEDVVYKDVCVMESNIERGWELASDYTKVLKRDVVLYRELSGKTILERVKYKEK